MDIQNKTKFLKELNSIVTELLGINVNLRFDASCITSDKFKISNMPGYNKGTTLTAVFYVAIGTPKYVLEVNYKLYNKNCTTIMYDEDFNILH